MSDPKDPLSPRPASPAPAPESLPPASRDDSSAQALSDALRSSFFIIKILMVVLVVVFLGSGFFTVQPQEKAIILRFGKPVGTDESALLGPGPHWAFPYPIDEVVHIPVGEVQTLSSTVGWYDTTPAMEAAKNEPPPGRTLNPITEGYVLTGDGSIVHARATLRYRIAEPGLRYVFELANASNLVQNALNNALNFAAVQSTVEVTRDITPFREKVTQRLDQLIAEQKLDIAVDQLSAEVIAPRQLTADFERVLDAEVKKSSALSDARSYETKTMSQAKADSQARVNTAEAERKGMVEQVAAEAKRFTDLLPEYRKNPQLFMDLLYAQGLEAVFTNVTEKMMIQERLDGKPRELRLLLNREPPKPKSAEVETGHEH